MSDLGYCSYTVWKFQNFPVIQILREIHLGESISSKIAGFAKLEALGEAEVNLAHFSLQKVQKFKKVKIQGLRMC